MAVVYTVHKIPGTSDNGGLGAASDGTTLSNGVKLEDGTVCELRKLGTLTTPFTTAPNPAALVRLSLDC